MLTFDYEARNPETGQKVKAQVQADSERSAARLIQEQGLAPLSIKVQQDSSARAYRRVKTKDKVLFARQLATLVNAGLPVVQSLRTVQQQTTNKVLKLVTDDVIANVEGGQSLADALKKYPAVFGEVFTSMIAAGEASGTLDSTLDRLAIQQEKDADVLSKIKGAMVYPLVVVFIMLAVLVFMLVGVLPQVKTLYEGMGAGQMPLITRALLSLSDFVINFWWLLILLTIAVLVFGRRWLLTPGGKRYTDKLKLKLKPINRLFMKVYMARFSRTGATLVASGVPLIQTLEITADAVNNVFIKESIGHAIEQVKGGKSLAESLKGDPNFLELVPSMLKIGEQSGAIEQMMSKTADYYEKEVDTEIKNISTIIEPALMIILGVVALIIVVAVLLPIYGLAGKAFVR
jgi:type IV pilus assembly protein PilC